MHRPSDVGEALRVLSETPHAVPLAGGTDLMVEVNFGYTRPDAVLMLRRLDELTDLSPTRVGAGVTFKRLESGDHQALAQLARTVGSPQIRAAGTIGGNVATASPAGDSLPFLAAVDASIELQSVRGTRTISWDEFLVGVKRTSKEADELITAVHFPESMPEHQEFGKVGQRSAMVISMVSACVLRWRDGTTRVALGAVGPTPVRVRRAEELISDEINPSEAALAEFARLVAEDVTPITDHRGTADYRRHASGVLARRLLERCLRT
jgi:CO/xanthine dehydrogenase FAD-binding subunit